MASLPSQTRKRSGERLQTKRIYRAGLMHAAQPMSTNGLKPVPLASRGGKFGGDQHLAAQRFAQRFNARDLIDRRPDHREVEPVNGAYIAVKDFADMQREVDLGNRFARFPAYAIHPAECAHCFRRGIERPAAGFVSSAVSEPKD